jgi:tetratricopeptide (TPR) repeat protein
MNLGYSHRFTLHAPPSHGIDEAARLYQARDYVNAERCCRELLQHEPRHFEALHLIGVVCLNDGRLTDAVRYLQLAASEQPDNARVHYHLGTALLGVKQYEPAEAALRRALELQPRDSNTLVNLGNVLAACGRHSEAIHCYQQVLVNDTAHLHAQFNFGRSLAAMDRLDEAVATFRTALATAPADLDANRLADIYVNLGQALVGLGRYDKAIAACRAIADSRPQEAAWNESLILLLLGQYEEGWRKYEARFGIADHDPPRADARVPTLAEVHGKQVLLVPEQGHGDLIQFARYVPLLADRGADVTLSTYAELKPLMQTLPGVGRVVLHDEAEPPVDIVTPLLSLPLVFGTRVNTVPARVPYLHAPTKWVSIWQPRLGPRVRSRIGLCWWGSQHILKRSLSVEMLLPLLSIPDLEVHALQKEIPADQRDWLAKHGLLIDHSAELQDYADTAALISLLDLVVTIDTSVAHLAGALAAPVWIMLQHNADWRWLVDRSDSPWYPTARLFRQRQAGNWAHVVAEVTSALRCWAGQR